VNVCALDVAVATAISARWRVLFHYSRTASDKTASAASVRRRNRGWSFGEVSKSRQPGYDGGDVITIRSTARILHRAQVQVLRRLRSMLRRHRSQPFSFVAFATSIIITIGGAKERTPTSIILPAATGREGSPTKAALTGAGGATHPRMPRWHSASRHDDWPGAGAWVRSALAGLGHRSVSSM
jgi:hypothetical protein